MNHAIHCAAVIQLRHDTNGHACYHKKVPERKTQKEAVRALKRRTSDTIYTHLIADTTGTSAIWTRVGSGRTPKNVSESSVASLHPES